MSVTLEIHRPGEAMETLSFVEPAEFVIGRNPDCACCLKDDALVSRKHAVLLINPPTISVRDLKSTNGIVLNGVKRGGTAGNPVHQPEQLREGDEIAVGKTVIRVGVADSNSLAPRLTQAQGASGDTPMDLQPVRAQREGGIKFDIGRERTLPSVPGYKVMRVIGSGGMASVYLAENEETGEKAAIKLMTGAMALKEKMVETFKREIEVTKAAVHPNIVRFFGAGVTGRNQLYLALEYVDGGDLAAYIRKRPDRRLTLEEAFPFMLQTTDAMAYAHGLGFVHRDIKPHNILLATGPDGLTAKVSDLGLAKNFESAGMSGLTNSFTGGGTMAYMPPEQLTDFRDVKPSADVFGLAAMFYEILSGKVAYNFGDKGTSLKVVSECDVVPIRERLPDIPSALADVFDKSLAAIPANRYQDASELLAALKAAHKG